MPGDRIDRLLDQLTLEEQVSLLSGRDFWSVPAIPRLGIGALKVTDGPNGARGGGSEAAQSPLSGKPSGSVAPRSRRSSTREKRPGPQAGAPRTAP